MHQRAMLDVFLSEFPPDPGLLVQEDKEEKDREQDCGVDEHLDGPPEDGSPRTSRSAKFRGLPGPPLG